MNLFRRKSVTELQAEAVADHRLPRALSGLNLTLLGIGAIIGTGIFVLTGTVAALHAGPAVVLSFALAGVASILAALCYAELAALVPVAGSAYSYGYATLGELVAWIIGWDLVLEYTLGAAVIAIGWSSYAVPFLHGLGIDMPCAWSAARGAAVTCADGTQRVAIANLPAALVVLVVTLLLVVGIRRAAAFNNVLVSIKIMVVLVFVVGATHGISTANWSPFIPSQEGFGSGGVLAGAAMVFFSYIGFDAVSTAAQEARNPQRDIPIGILGSLLTCTVLYVLVAAIATGVVPYGELNVPNPIALVAERAGLGWLRILIELGGIAGLTSVVLVLIFGQSRVFYAMSRDGLLPPLLSAVHPEFRTPHVATVITGTTVAMIAVVLPMGEVVNLVSIGTLLAFAIVAIGVLVLRLREPALRRPFTVPAIWFVAPAGLASAVYLMSSLPAVSWKRLGLWFALGMAMYFAYGMRKSRLATRVSPGSDR